MRGKKRLLTAFAALLFCAGTTYSATSAAAGRFHMSYLYFGAPSGYAAAVQAAKGALDEVSPSYFDLNTDGALKLTASVSQTFVDEMHRQKIRVVPFLSNHWDRALGAAALENQEELVRQIVDAVEQYDLDGINVDLENLTQDHRQAYSAFVERLRAQLPEGKTLAVAVAANPYGLTVGWHASYDYRRLGAAADYLMLMTYDEHYQGSSPGPITSQRFAEQSILYALQFVPAEKIVLGIPFYGRIWSDSGSVVQGQGLSDVQIGQLIETYRGVVTYDQTSRSAKAVISVGAADKKPVVGGKTLPAGSYTIWYENEAAKKELLKLVRQYDLMGAGSWSLGQETGDTWDYFDLWLNGKYFTDTQGHWAMGEILTAASAGWMSGTSSETFHPDRPLTRAEAAVILARKLGLSAAPEGKGGYGDTAGHWAQAEIAACTYHGLLSGVGENSFRPDDLMSRGEAAVVLARVLGGAATGAGGESRFYDVTRLTCPWSYDAILRMDALGIMNGGPDGGFRPKAQLSRAEMAALLTRLTEK